MMIQFARFLLLVIPGAFFWKLFQKKEKKILNLDCLMFVFAVVLISYAVDAVWHRNVDSVIFFYRLKRDSDYLIKWLGKNILLSAGVSTVFGGVCWASKNKGKDILIFRGKRIVSIVLVVLTLAAALMPSAEKWMADRKFDYSWAKQNLHVAHALGGIDGHTYTNSREAFLLSYDLGYRIFETDITVTDDGIPVLLHGDWQEMIGKEDMDFTYDNFRSELLYGEYHSMDYRDILDMMEEYPDIYVDIDMKSSNYADILSRIKDYADEKKPEILDRLIIEIFSEEMLDTIMEIYPWKSIKYCIYAVAGTKEEIAEFCLSSGIKLVSCAPGGVGDELAEQMNSAGIMISVFGINDEAEAEALFEKGVTMINTDFLAP